MLTLAGGGLSAPHEVTLVSTSASGDKGNAQSQDAVASEDGTVVAFVSLATNLAPGDTDALFDIYVKNLATGNVRLASVSATGAKANGHSFNPSVSADGTKLAFDSNATNLHPNDTDTQPDVYVLDLMTGTLTLASTSAAGEKGDHGGFQSSLSRDGSKVAFSSTSKNLHPDLDLNRSAIYVKQLLSEDITIASTTELGFVAGGQHFSPSISHDGTYVAFESITTELDPADSDSITDIYVKNLGTGDVALASRATSGAKGNGASQGASLSQNGTKVAFSSLATNLDAADADATSDVYVRDIAADELLLVSRSSAGTKSNGSSNLAAISADGTRVGFQSIATNLDPVDTEAGRDVYVKDLDTGGLYVGSTSYTGRKGNAVSEQPSLTADGTKVVFQSQAGNLNPADPLPGTFDIFLKELGDPPPPTPIADLAVSTFDFPDPVASAGQVQYSVQVQNQGPYEAKNVQVTDDLPDGTVLVSASGFGATCDTTSDPVVCTWPIIEPFQSKSLQIVVQVPGAPTVLTNTASATTTSIDPSALNNSDVETTEVRDPADLSIDDAVVTEGDAGQTDATFTVTLNGPSTEPVTVDFATADGTATGSFSDPKIGGGFVTRQGNRLLLDGAPYRFAGLNIYNANSNDLCWYPYSAAELDSTLVTIGAGGGKGVVRAWFFQQLATSGGVRDWSAFDRTLDRARANGFKVIATLIDQWGNCGSLNPAGAFKDEAWYTDGYMAVDPVGTVSYRDWLAEVVGRYKDDPTILAWEPVNEAEVRPSEAGGCSTNAGEILRTFMADVTGLMKSIDSNHLVSSGVLGDGNCGAQWTDYKDLHALATIDLCSYHDYRPAMPMPGDEFNGLQKRLEQCGELGKPVIVGEAGVPPPDVGGTLAARDRAFHAKLLRQIPAGVAGFLPWAWNREGSSLVTFDIGPGDPVLDTLAAFGDYDSTAGTLTFAPGETSKTLTVKVNGDLLDEFDETFSVRLANAVNTTVIDGEGTGTILDDDQEPSLSIDDVDVAEGDAGTQTARFTVSLTAPSGKTVTVAFATAPGTATAGEDYVTAGGTLTFEPGQTTKTVEVAVNGDIAVETDETFHVNLTAPANASVGDGDGLGTITNDDANSPPVVSGGTDASVDEGSPFSRAGSFADPDADTWTATVDYGDGTGAQELPLNADKTFQLAHTYADNGAFTVVVTVSDGTDTGSDSFAVTVGNVAPTVDAGPDTTISAGETFTSAGSFTDPGSLDTHTATVDYGDGSGVQALTLNADKTFALSHLYADAGTYTVTVTVTDDDGGVGTDTAVVTVRAVANTPPLVDAGGDGFTFEGSEFSRFGSFTDPDPDLWTATVDYGDGAGPEPLPLGFGNTFMLSHTYADDGLHTVVVTVSDGTDTGSDSFALTVGNVAPTVDAGPDKTISAGETFTSAGSFTDPGADSWTGTVDYGDGSGPQALTLNPDGTFALSHLYATAGTFFVTVSVSDDDGGVGSDFARVLVTGSADLSLTKVDSPDPVVVGTHLSYTLTVTNSGPDPAPEVVVEDELPAGVSFVSATPAQGFCGESGGTVTCQLFELGSGQQVEVRVTVLASQLGTFTNTASVSSAASDPDPADNADTEETTVEAAPPPPDPCLTYTDFSPPSGLSFRGSAQVVGDVLRLTPAAFNTQAQVWYASKVAVADGFETNFHFRFTDRGGIGDEDGAGADGITFAIQNVGVNTVGGEGGSLGYAQNANSLVVEFDSFNNGAAFGDPNGNHVAVHSRGTAENGPGEDSLLGGAVLTPLLQDGALHHARIVYEPSGQLRVYLDDLTTAALTVAVQLDTLLALDAGTAFVGFTSATGSGFENHDLTDWSYCLPVSKANTTTSITSDVPDPSLRGQAVTVSFSVAAVSPGTGTPTGNVTVSDGVDSCTATVAAGQCSLSLTTVGDRTLVATYAGDADFNGSTSAGEPHTVRRAATTTTITSDTPDPSVQGQAVTVSFSVAPVAPGAGTPTGNVTVSDGVDSCTATVAAGQCLLTLTTFGSRTLVATYAGDDGFEGSASAGVPHNVITSLETTTSIDADTPDPSVRGQSVTVRFSVRGPQGAGTPTGNVTVGDGVDSCTATVAAGQCLVTLTTVGSRTLVATYAGDGAFAGSTSAGESHTVNRAATTTTITGHVPDPSVRGQAVTVNFSVTAVSPGAGTPSGNVTVSDGVDSCTATVAAGQCSLTLTTAGQRTLTATYGGDNNFNGSISAGEPHTVNKADTTTTVTADLPDPSVRGQAVTVSFSVAAVSPGAGAPSGNVNVSDGVDSCTATVAAGQCSLSLTTVGDRILVATYAGDVGFSDSTSTGVPHTVNKADTTTTITGDAPDPSQQGQAVTVGFSVTAVSPGAGTPSGNVTVSDGVDSCTAAVSGGQGQCSLTLTTAGNRTLIATYAGDDNFNGSTSAGEPHGVQPSSADLAVSVTASSASRALGDDYRYTIVVNNLGPDTAAPVTLTGDLAPAVHLNSAPAVCSGTTHISCLLGSLAAGTSQTIVLVVDARFNCTHVGTSGNDAAATIGNSSGNDVICGGGGGDTFSGGGGNDELYGLAPPEVITALPAQVVNTARVTAATADPVPGNNVASASVTVVAGTDGGDTVSGNDGDDTINGNVGADSLSGGDGGDVINGGDHADTIFGGIGDDSIFGDAFNAVAGRGDDLHGGAGADVIFGIDGADTINGDAGNDRVNGGDDQDTIDGGDGADVLQGVFGKDTLSGGDGPDDMWGDSNATPSGGTGAGNDTMNGNAGDDVLYGQDGGDTMQGAGGDDRLFGWTGADTLRGGPGFNFLDCGTGTDKYAFDPSRETQVNCENLLKP